MWCSTSTQDSSGLPNGFCSLVEHYNAPELAQQGVMGQKAYILGVIVCFVLALTFLLRFPWVNPFQDAQPPAPNRDRLNVKDTMQ